MKISMPSIDKQKDYIRGQETAAAIRQLKANLAAPKVEDISEINEDDYCSKHLLTKEQGFEAPHADIVSAYFRHLQENCPEYGTDKKLAELLGVSSNRRIREFKSGTNKVPYEIWRKLLITTGRATQDITKTLFTTT